MKKRGIVLSVLIVGISLPGILRVRPRSLRGITEFAYHQANRREVDESQRIPNPILKILGQATIAIEPRERAFDEPAFGQSDEAFHLLMSCDDCSGKLRSHFRHALSKLRPSIGPIGEQFGQPRKTLGQRREQRNPAVPILNVCRMHERLQD
jgi:hypothetical protein